MSRSRLPATTGSRAVRESARVAGWCVALYWIVSALGTLLEQHRAGAVAIQAFASEWGAGQLGVTWSDPEVPAPAGRLVARRIGVGVVLGLTASAVTLGFAVVTHAATFVRWGSAPYDLAAGLLVATLIAVRDELLLRGLVLRTFRHTLTPPTRVLVCGAVAMAARAGELADAPIATLFGTPGGLSSLAIAGLGGVCLSVAWLQERGGFLACGAHAAFHLATTTGIAGALCDARFNATTWGGGPEGFSGSVAVLTALALVTVATLTAAGATGAESRRWYRDSRRTG